MRGQFDAAKLLHLLRVTNRLDPRSVFCTTRPMHIETLLARPFRIDAIHAAYSMQAEHPQTGDVVREGYAAMKAAVARAADLIQAGYSIEIWSPASLERR